MSQLTFWTEQQPYQARWAPILLEPVVGTGERVTVAILVDQGDGLKVFPALRPAFIQAAFGNSAEDFRSLMSILSQSIEQGMFSESSIADWERPFDGVVLGEFSSAAGSSTQDIVDSAITLSSSFHWSGRNGSRRQKGTDHHKSRLLECEIRDSVIKLRPDSRRFFGRSIANSADRNDRRVGFFDDFYAAQFGVLTAGSSFGTSKAYTKSKLWDLERLRDTPRLFHDSLKLEFIGKRASMDDQSKNSVEDLHEQLAEEAAAAEIEFFVVSESTEAAERVLENSVLAA